VARKLTPRTDDRSASLVVGVTRMAWIYGKSRDWAERLFKQWEAEQLAGVQGIRVFRMGSRASLFTTTAILHQIMPPGRDLVLYRRMDVVEAGLEEAHQRMSRERIERQRGDADLQAMINRRRPA